MDFELSEITSQIRTKKKKNSTPKSIYLFLLKCTPTLLGCLFIVFEEQHASLKKKKYFTNVNQSDKYISRQTCYFAIILHLCVSVDI